MRRRYSTDPADWWIVEADDLGRTAMPGRVLAYQGAEVIRGLRYRVHAVRRAIPGDTGDEIAIKQSREEIGRMTYGSHLKAGNIAPPRSRHVA